MRRSLLLVVVVLCGVATTFGAPQSEKSRYLVATRKPAAEMRMKLGRDVAIRSFKSVHGFAAVLTEAEVAELKRSGDVLFIEPDLPRYAIGMISGEAPQRRQIAPLGISASAEAPQQVPYGVNMVAAPRIWTVGRGKTIKVGVIDTGIESEHPELRDSYKGGYDFVDDDEIPNDESGHGTHVAGTIAAADNEVGVVGVAPEVEIYSLKVLGGADGTGLSSDVIRALDWAIEHKLHIVNLSLGSERGSVLEEMAMQRLADAGIIAVAAAGNGYRGLDGLSYPASYNTVLSVGAVDSTQTVAGFSQRGSALKLVAPGVSVLSASMVTVDVTAGPSTLNADLLEGSPRGTITSEFVDCAYGRIGEFPAAVAGKLALIQRGPLEGEAITFREKVTNAVNAGAIGAVIYNHSEGDINWTLIRDGNNDLIPEAVSFPWPVTVAMTKGDGAALKALAAGTQITVSARAGGYGLMSGTSMSAPHVAGVLAAVWSIAPNATAAQVRQAVLDSAMDLGGVGFDTVFGFGLVNADSAAHRIAPEKFGTATRRRATGRP